ncbi:type I polyketide synthase [Candidatus Mycobacterium methanotrophicum]|uniref:Acyltransferase domain-containing protein n=6 Tax=Candidatus Mycobacterium methanotrophicum TaxID=2943498 RepID=A0ABY4QFB4_9MYCO|nr:type I polyketide synthase [Candidatus Mycobacterium methanotrophicum]UQX09680.1 acyltransferase domain-containing protein [Candidatus Mycobacterium methanotrophicum]
MNAPLDEPALRHWLVDHLVTNVRCSPDDIDFHASLKDLGVSSRDAVVLSGELSELLERPVSPVELWQHPTIDDLARFLTSCEPDSDTEPVPRQDQISADDPVAVIGVGCRFPGDVFGPEGFWRFLGDGRCAVGEVPPDRWAGFDDGSPEVAAALSGTTRWGSFLTDIDAFDAEFFEISPREAAKMDPQQRLLLEVAYEALEHAGLRADSLRQSRTGVFVGACAGEYGYLASMDLSQVDAWSGTGGALSIIANRLSYFLDLRGPSVTVDTACSSSLVAVHLACQSLRAGESSLAVAGGVNLLLSPAVTRSFDVAEAMSPTGRCHAFDAGADGFVRGEGCGVVVLKRLADAVADGDPVLAVVRGSAVNQDGRSNGLMAPNPAAQMDVLRAAYANAGIEPRQVDYVEAHGTGTLLGDPIEARALGRVLGRGRPESAPLLIGALKSNLGHLEAAAGIAGFIKAVLAVQRGRIPASLNFDNPNPLIPFDNLRLKVVDEPRDWPVTGQPRRAGVSAFGFGGTNAHVVVEQGPDPGPVAAGGPEPASAVTTLVVGGKTAQRVASAAGMLAGWMEGQGAGVALAEVAHTVNHHRARHAVFATVAALDREQAVAGLRALAAGGSAEGVVAPHRGQCRAGTVFVYSGQGSQWAGMGRQLLADEPVFAAAVAELEPVFVEQAGFSLQEVLAAGKPVVGIERIQPVLVAMGLALTQLWRCYGVQPDAVIGHSMGEVTAAVVAKALTPRDGLRIIATRSRLMSRLSGQGAMALLDLDPESAEALIVDYPRTTLAVYASPRQSVVAGPPDEVDAVIAAVAAQDRLARRIEVDVASHHPIIDPVLPELRTALDDLSPRRPTIPVMTTTGAMPVFDANYWAANLRYPVQFSQAVAAAGANYATFVEVSPHPVLTYAISDTLGKIHHHSIGTLQRDTHDTLTFHTNLNATHTVAPPATDHPAEPHPVIPTTPWHHTRHWLATEKRVDTTASAPKFGTLLGAHIAVATSPPTRLWQARLLPEAKPYPGCHRIHGVEVVPVSVLLQTICAAVGECGASAVADVRFEHPIVVDQPRIIQVVVDGESVTVSSAPAADLTTGAPPAHWVKHVSGRMAPAPASFGGAGIDGSAADDGHHETAENGIRSAAQLLESWGVDGQPFAWSVQALRPTPGGLVADVCSAEQSTVALLDAAVHVGRLVDTSDARLMVPAAVESVWVSTSSGDRQGAVEIRRVSGNTEELVVDIAVYTPEGTTCVDIRSLRYADIESGPAQAIGRDADPRSCAHAIDWRAWSQDHDGPATAPGTLAVVGGEHAVNAELQDRLTETGYTPAGAADARYVVYLAEPGPASHNDNDIESAAALSSDVADLVRQLADRHERLPVTLWIITRGVHEAVSRTALPQSSLWGLAAVIAAEHPNLWGGLVDVPVGDDVEDCVTALSKVLPGAAKRILVLRDGELLASTMAPISGQPVREPLRCRPDAAYMITGGMGALGLLMAGWLADRGARRLILVGRTPLPPRRDWDSTSDTDLHDKIAAIRALEYRGVTVDAVALDIGSPEALRILLAKRDREGSPPIRGVIHAAGVTESALLTETTHATFQRVMWPKIAGSQSLHMTFPPQHLDFFYLTASAGTVFGVPGQAGYAAANAYLDCLARTRHRQGCHTVSLDWVAWQGRGFGADAAVTVHELERHGSRPLSAEEAFAAWQYVDCYDVAQAVMAPMSATDSAGPGESTPVRAWSELSAEELLRELETELRQVLARELRLVESELESDRPFAELGLNSVMAMSIRREVEQLTGIELSVTMLWNHPTIAALTEHLAKKLSHHQDSVDDANGQAASSGRVLDELFAHVESAQ